MCILFIFVPFSDFLFDAAQRLLKEKTYRSLFASEELLQVPSLLWVVVRLALVDAPVEAVVLFPLV